jgi:hypothetical protein
MAFTQYFGPSPDHGFYLVSRFFFPCTVFGFGVPKRSVSTQIHTSYITIIPRASTIILHQPSRIHFFTFLVPKFIKFIIIDVGFSSYLQMPKYLVYMPYYYQIKSTEFIVRHCLKWFLNQLSKTINNSISSLTFILFHKWHKRVSNIAIQIQIQVKYTHNHN